MEGRKGKKERGRMSGKRTNNVLGRGNHGFEEEEKGTRGVGGRV